ncbi:hypothetical protein MIMGU_mgv1a010820mg [Erythranthe guttata]|uniref:Fe2OG dioxygenase domain-containing protein n=1 Tax=Erythranthe guttata TaxID=4155 RepID=A0A022QE56_ERYGU|nr:PREDICTED: 2-oxoglutarate-dependent dioxygenase DAO-like isoform X2 [Erythranthe guttata]EYU26231.1 hypothetical protein MIMGU_mgv1a010820mg [Erythranthe guttata]|eukprot:XP_012850583.1 PREDICTED: 2-oxoglutarate-dependent dioxygenase DAO-like isoform X2 [Erythranthe guttata]
MAKKSVPIIDMQDLANVPEKIVKAFEEWGSFRLINHGVPIELMSEMKAVTRSLMDLPMEIKRKNYHPDSGKGEILEKYGLAVYDLAHLIGCKMMEGLGLGGEVFKEWVCQLKMNKYNFAPETVGLTGALIHTDPGFLTILQDDEIVRGLELVDEITGELVSIDPIPGAFVVNLGDVAKVWSNGRFCNVKHRVQCYEPKVRVSIALFVLAPKDVKVEAPPQLVDSDHPRRYIPLDFEDYRKLRSSTQSPIGGALQLFLAKSS